LSITQPDALKLVNIFWCRWQDIYTLTLNVLQGPAMRTRSLPLNRPRRFMADLCHITLGVPLGVIKRRINIGDVLRARAAAAAPVPWTVLFCKAWALAARDRPVLRQAYCKLPWPQLAEAEASVALIMIERAWHGERALFPAKLNRPAERTLTDLAADLARSRNAPIPSIRHFLVIDRICAWPGPIRRFLWWIAFNIGALRPTYFGTFGISVLGQSSAEIVSPVSPLTSFVSYGPFQPDGFVDVTIAFDHRVMDGAHVVEAILALEGHLNGLIMEELQGLGPPP
jgi:hypothetical protein